MHKDKLCSLLLFHTRENYNTRCLEVKDTERLLAAEHNRCGQACDMLVVLGVHVGIDGVLALILSVSHCTPPSHLAKAASHLQVGSLSGGQPT